ncbi:MAG: hypothetical protein E7009_03545 [Alphaproteobacteria bacterium]|nr:hypothetical protein [Alphaproteobacteria bacterium]
MKKLLTLTAVGAILTAPATAVQKCVTLDSSKKCTRHETNSEGYYKVNQNLTCYGTNNEEVEVTVISACVDTGSTYAQGAALDNIERIDSLDAYGNDRCWCKMVSPAVSKWVYIDGDEDFEWCAKSCTNTCAAQMANTSYQTARTAFFTNLSD